MRTRSTRLGFTFTELMIAVAIVGAAATFVFGSIDRRKESMTIETFARDLKARLGEARGLSAIAGPRLGTNRLTLVDCDVVGGDPQLWITVDPILGFYRVPVEVRYDDATDTLVARCSTFAIAPLTGGLGVFTQPGATIQFAFTASGRVMGPTPTPNLYIRVGQAGQAQVAFGMRILPSGVLCASSNASAVECDVDP